MTGAATAARTRKPPQDHRAKSNGKVFDADAAYEAAVAEATDQGFAFSLKGKTFTLPPAHQWPLEVSDALGRNSLGEALELMLGEKDYQRFRACKPTMGHVQAIMAGLAEHAGVELPGN